MPDDLSDPLVRLHAALPAPTRTADHVRRSVLDGDAGRRRRRRLQASGLAAAASVVAVVGLLAVTRSDGRDQIRTEQAPSTPSLPGGDSGTAPAASPSISAAVDVGSSPWTTTFSEPPLADRAVELVVSMGDSIFVWGGFVPNHQDGSEPPFADGAVLDVASGSWRPTAASPLAGGLASGVWTGTEVVVSNGGTVAAYDPVRDAWRDLAAPAPVPAATGTTQLAYVGGEVVIPLAGLAWNSETATWRTMAAAPEILSESRVDVVGGPGAPDDGGDLVVSGAPIRTPDGVVALRYDVAADQWIELPALGRQVHQGGAIGVVGNDLIVVSWIDMQASALDLTSLQWRELPAFPRHTVKCLGELQAVENSIAVVSMCGQIGALVPGAEHWVAFDPPSASATFGMIPVDAGLVVGGAVLDTASGGWFASSLLGPVSAGGASVDRSTQPVIVRNGASVRVELSALDCVLDVDAGDEIDQQTVEAARELSRTAPQAVSFLNQRGAYTLECPDVDAYAAAFDALTVRGERGIARDAMAFFDPPLRATASPEEMVEAVADFVGSSETAAGREPSIGLSQPAGDPPTFLVDSYVDDGASEGRTFTIALEQTDAGWVIADATVQSICTWSVAATDSCG